MIGEASSKARIRAAFGHAWDYDAQATVQAKAARTLAAMAAERGLPSAPAVLDMGCGTGNTALALAQHVSPGLYLCADLCPAMLQRARENFCRSPALAESFNASRTAVLFAAMDAEYPALAGTFDLVISNMALQWTSNPATAIAGLWALVRPGGLLALSLPGPETFRQWRQAHERLGLACGLWEYPDLLALQDMLPVEAAVSQEHHTVKFARAIDFPRHLKALGGFIPRQGHAPLPPAHFRAVLGALDAAFPEGPELTYQIFYALASKPKERP